jgi:hypothetical protein
MRPWRRLMGLPSCRNSGRADVITFGGDARCEGMTYSDVPREPPSYHCGNGCSFYVFETGEQIERSSYFFIVS